MDASGRRMTYNAALDGLRAIAILLVIGVHTAILPAVTAPLGVDLFFVLSGFLITALLVSEWDALQTVSLRAFYVRRVCRLAPALLFLIATYVTYGLTTGQIGSPRHVLIAAGIGLGYVQNLFLAASSHLVAGHLVPLWSLAEEEQFYLIWPVLLILALRRRTSSKRLIGYLGLYVAAVMLERGTLYVVGASSNRIMYGVDTHSDALVLGCIAGIAFARGVVSVIPTPVPLLAAIAAICIAAAGAQLKSSGEVVTVTSPVFPACCAILVLALVSTPQSSLARILGVLPLRYLGRISYSVYLWHVPLMRFAGIGTGLVLTAGLSAMSFRYLEQPIRTYGRRWSASGRPLRPTVAPARAFD